MNAQARQPYSSDLTDAQWAILEPLLPPPVAAGAPRKTNFREVLNGDCSIILGRFCGPLNVN